MSLRGCFSVVMQKLGYFLTIIGHFLAIFCQFWLILANSRRYHQHIDMHSWCPFIIISTEFEWEGCTIKGATQTSYKLS